LTWINEVWPGAAEHRFIDRLQESACLAANSVWIDRPALLIVDVAAWFARR
jgi:hypothetical protein